MQNDLQKEKFQINRKQVIRKTIIEKNKLSQVQNLQIIITIYNLHNLKKQIHLIITGGNRNKII